MRIRMKVDLSGTYNEQPWPRRGGVAEVPDVVGAKMCASELATPVTPTDVEAAVPDDPAIEAVSPDGVETAVVDEPVSDASSPTDAETAVPDEPVETAVAEAREALVPTPKRGPGRPRKNQG